MIFFIRFKEWVVVITKYEKKQAILVDFRLFFSHEVDYNFAYLSLAVCSFPGLLYGCPHGFLPGVERTSGHRNGNVAGIPGETHPEIQDRKPFGSKTIRGEVWETVDGEAALRRSCQGIEAHTFGATLASLGFEEQSQLDFADILYIVKKYRHRNFLKMALSYDLAGSATDPSGCRRSIGHISALGASPLFDTEGIHSYECTPARFFKLCS